MESNAKAITGQNGVYFRITESQHKLLCEILQAVEDMHMRTLGRPSGKVSLHLDMDVGEACDLEEMLKLFNV